MPLLDRLKQLGLLDSDDEGDQPVTATDEKGSHKDKDGVSPPETDSEEADSPLQSDGDESASEGVSDSDSDSACDSDSASASDDSDMSAAEERADRARQAVQQAVGNSHGLLTRLGQAERRRLASCVSSSGGGGGWVGLEYPTGDDDAGAGFRLCGFRDGRRVYRLGSRLLPRLRRAVVKTAVGLCYLDVAAQCPPVVVPVPVPVDADADAADVGAGPEAIHPPIRVLANRCPRALVNNAFLVQPSPLGGLGSFAARALARGTHVLVERPLVRTTLFHLPRALERLPAAARAAYFALAGHHPDARATAAERVWTANTFVAGGREAVFAVASRFNHACAPRDNVGYRYDRRHDVLVMTALRPVAAGEELLISYGKTPRMLFARYGFRCKCGACGGFGEGTGMGEEEWYA